MIQPQGSGPIVGLAVGEGTGPELAQVFEDAMASLAAAAGARVRIDRSPVRFRTFGGLTGLSAADVERSSDEDAAAYQAFLLELAARGCRVVFRTAINAQPLYTVRERLACVKIESLPNPGGEILLLRDQTQGFYAGENDRDGSPDEIRRTCRFTRAHTFRLLDFALEEAARRWGDRQRIGVVAMAYKFHLLDRRFASWASDYARERGVDVRVFQPDTMNRHLLRGTFRGNLVVVGGNEWGDIMHADLLARAGLGNQDERCSRNVYLAPEVGGLTEYQTVHGSADDIAGADRVNPTATLRAAARILEDHAGVAGAVAAVEAGLSAAAAAGVTTPDAGGRHGTRAAGAHAIERAVEALRRPAPLTAASDTAVLVIDMQRDYCAPDGRFAALGLIDPQRTAALVEPMNSLLAAARARGLPVIFVRSVADEHLLPPNMAERNHKLGRGGYLRSGERGAEFFGVEPLPGDLVVTKIGYDAFLGTDLEARLAGLGVRRLLLAGVFTEICVDAAARTAYQKGFGVTLVTDATMPLERDAREAASFMSRYYGATLIGARELAAAAA